MFDVFLRALLNPLDYWGMTRRRTLVFKEMKRESDTIYTFYFRPTKFFSWKAGQHGVFYLPKRNVNSGKNWRAFSIASAPHEGVIQISTIIKETPSDFKQTLLTLKPGDTLRMRGPFGEFYRTPRMKNIVGIAGGIGITPFRSLLLDLARNTSSSTHITLIYSAAGGYTYKEELDDVARDKRISIIYTETPEEVNAALEALVATHHNNATYFISGSPGMIGALRGKLTQLGVRNIVNDPFKGY